MADESPPVTGQVERVPPDQALAVLGRPVDAQDGRPVGRLVDVLVGADGVPQAAVIDFGGFLGVGSRKVAVHWSALRFSPANTKQPITLELTLDQVKAVPEYRDPTKPAPVVMPDPTEPAGSSASQHASPGSGSP